MTGMSKKISTSLILCVIRAGQNMNMHNMNYEKPYLFWPTFQKFQSWPFTHDTINFTSDLVCDFFVTLWRYILHKKPNTLALKSSHLFFSCSLSSSSCFSLWAFFCDFFRLYSFCSAIWSLLENRESASIPTLTYWYMYCENLIYVLC